MTLVDAQRAAGELRVALLDNGVRRVSLELQQGVAGSGWGVAPFKRGMGHHIASRPSQGLTPGLALVKRGRTDLTGPLCNGYGGFDLTARIITMGWANHPGAGGPWSVPGWGTVARDNGRPYIFGWEFEGGYEPYTDEMHDFMAHCGAGTLQWLGGAPLECWGEHKTWAPDRKVDRIGYTTASGRARIAAARNSRPLEEDVPITQQEFSGISDVVANRPIGPFGAIWQTLNVAATQATAAAKQTATLSSAITALTKLVAEQNGLTVEDVRRVVSEEVSKGLDVDVTIAGKVA